ncbi:MAG: electron transfer flavoprotein subunit beta/FixA family protein [Candidatus Choladocola sp.]|nr:electron transfer flavoprotein subunit beta/FixA family protein [Candidatus Choladocola sp.]
MKIIVCMKQVPAGTRVDIDPETGAMKRMSGETRTNPYDLFALEAALQLREKAGGTVTVLTMGPPQAESMMRDAYTMGADDAVILSDRKFAGADVLSTSYVLSQGIQVLGGADLIICGRQTTDGDTAQVGPPLQSIWEFRMQPGWLRLKMPIRKKYVSVRIWSACHRYLRYRIRV